MKKYLIYTFYLLRHKWYVLLSCLRVGLVWQGLIHDWSKFLPIEYVAYSKHFYGSKRERESHNYDRAWLHHIHRNPHHWEHWVIPQVGGVSARSGIFKPHSKAVPMPEKYALEMLCDWNGAGRAQGTKTTTREWFDRNRDRIILHPNTEVLLKKLFAKHKWLG